MSASAGWVYYLHGENNNLSYEKEIKDNGLIEHKHYLSAGGIVFALQVTRTGNTATGGVGGSSKPAQSLTCMHHDHLGSVSVLTDETGSVLQDGRLAYDPWGKRRFPNGTADTTDSIVGLTMDRGFTMHEHLDEMGVIHMNGRIYDPLIGRFMSADPFIQAPENLQSHNRFAYVMNNPLAYTDPSGYFSLKKLFRAVLAIAVGYFTGQWIGNAIQAGAGAGSSLVSWSTNIATGGSYASGLSGLGGAIAGAGGGFAAGLVGSGSLKGALQGAFSGGVFGAIGGLGSEGGWSTGQYVAAHAAGGCITSVAGGGACGSGALSAAFGKYATLEGPQFDHFVADGIKAAVVGGIGSAIGGGKFENGAMTAAFAYMFNCGLSKCWKSYARIAAGTYAIGEAAMVCAATVGAGCAKLGVSTLVGANSIAQGVDGLVKGSNDGTNFAVEALKARGMTEKAADYAWATVEVAGAGFLLNSSVVTRVENWIRVLPNRSGVQIEKVVDSVNTVWNSSSGVGKSVAAGFITYDAISPSLQK